MSLFTGQVVEFEGAAQERIYEPIECLICKDEIDHRAVEVLNEGKLLGYICFFCWHRNKEEARQMLMHRAESLKAKAEELEKLALGKIELPIREDLCQCGEALAHKSSYVRD